jgi:hypothetical protein
MEGLAILVIIISLAVFKALVRKGTKTLSGETKLKIVFGFFVVVSLVSSLIGFFFQPFGAQEIGLSLFNAVFSIGFWYLIYLAIKKKFFKKEGVSGVNAPIQPPGGAMNTKMNIGGDAIKIFAAVLIGFAIFAAYNFFRQ